MAFTDVLNRIETHAQTAGNSLTNAIKDVKIGYPKAPAAGGRSVRIFWGGEVKPAKMGDSELVLNGQMVSDLVVIVAFWSLSNLSEETAEVIELEARAFTAAFRTAVLGDAQLNGNVTDLYLQHGDTDFPVLAGTQYRTVTFEAICDFTEYTLAP